MTIQWVSKEYETIEDAQKSQGSISFFERFAIFETPYGKYIAANMQFKQWTKAEVNEIAENVERLTGNRMVSYTDALFGWTVYRD